MQDQIPKLEVVDKAGHGWIQVWTCLEAEGNQIIQSSLTLKEVGGVQNDPLVRRMSVISHMVMLWS